MSLCSTLCPDSVKVQNIRQLIGDTNLRMHNKKTPKGVYAGCVGVRKNNGYVGWQWKVEWCMQQMCAGETEMFC